MAEKTLNSRIILKHDTEANWFKATNFKPIAGEVIIYDVDENYSYPRIKIGDGNTLINELPFAATRPDWNAVEGEEGYIGNKPNVVTSINGTLLPDENGDIQMITVDTLQFMDMSGFGGGIQCNKTAEEAFKTVSGQGVLVVYRRLWLGDNDGNPLDAYALDVVSRSFDPKILKIDFKDGRAPIIVNATDNTITLDPDWVAPDPIIPDAELAHQQLVTDGDGNKVWVNQTHYSDIVMTEIFPQTDVEVTKHPNLSCYWSVNNSLTTVLIENAVYTITFNGSEYSCSPCTDSAGFKYLGNPSLWKGDANTGNNEPFALRFVGDEAYLVVSNEGTYSLEVTGPVETFYKISGDYTGFYHNDVGAINTDKNVVGNCAKGSFGLSGMAMGEGSFAQGSASMTMGKNAVALNGSTALSENQLTHGKNNIVDTAGKYAHIVGNGVTSRSNAYTLDWSGNAWFSGDVYVGSTSGTNKDDGSKKLATEEYINNAAATDEEIIDMMLSIDMMPVVQDADGSILVDSDEAILMI